MKKGIYRFLARVSEVTELPLNEMCKGFSVYVTGRREVTADGVLSIKKYESECIVLQVCGGTVTIFGHNLFLKNYYHAILSVGGEVDRVDFDGGMI